MNSFMQHCRLCTNDRNVSFTVLHRASDGKRFIDKLETVIPEIDNCNILLPNGICTVCAVQLNDAYTFIKQCLKSQIILKQRQLNEQLCRLCASKENISLTLNNLDSDNILLSYKLETIASEILKCNEQLSNCICSTCSVRLNETYKFREKCFKSEIFFKRNTKTKLHNSAVMKKVIVEDDTKSCLNNEGNIINLKTVSIKKEIIDEDSSQLDLNTDTSIRIEENFESENNTNFENVYIKEEIIDEEYSMVNLETDTNIKFEESLKLENLNLHSEITIKEENSDFKSETDIRSCQANINTIKQDILSSKEKKKLAEKARPHKCTLCEKAFTKSTNLTVHIRTHTQEKPYKCEICEKAFSATGNLKRHINFHNNERPHKCTICGKAFTQRGDLNKHFRLHTQERPYKCKVCQKAFTTSGNLNAHIRYHTQEKPYKCEMCGTAFTQSAHLKSHMRSHTQEKPYKCELCEKGYTRRESLHKHIRSHK